MSPRNEFMNHEEEPDDGDFELEIVRDGDGTPIDIRKVRKNHPGKGEDEGQGQEVAPVEDDPHMWPAATQPKLADLRGIPGGATTRSHIAERYSASDEPLT